jgi:carbonic anhydrase
MQTSEIIRQIISGNIEFTNSHIESYFTSHEQKQTPYITLVSCSDSRVPSTAIMPDTVNRVFTIENIGNQILSTEGSVDYGIFHLKTPVLMIMGHSDCGAIKAYMHGFSEESYNIKRELDFFRPIINAHEGEHDFHQVLSFNIERNIDYQVSIAYKKYKDLIIQNKLVIIGAYYDFLNDFNKGKGRIIFVNVNKKKEVGEIIKTPFFENISEAEKQFFIGRI